MCKQTSPVDAVWLCLTGFTSSHRVSSFLLRAALLLLVLTYVSGCYYKSPRLSELPVAFDGEGIKQSAVTVGFSDPETHVSAAEVFEADRVAHLIEFRHIRREPDYQLHLSSQAHTVSASVPPNPVELVILGNDRTIPILLTPLKSTKEPGIEEWIFSAEIPLEAYSENEEPLIIQLKESPFGITRIRLLYQVQDLMIRVNAETPSERHTSRGRLRQWTYPLWGLPRDLLDVPLTFLNRAGVGVIFRSLFVPSGVVSDDSKAAEQASLIPLGITMSGTVAGFALGAYLGLREGAWHFGRLWLYSTVGGVAGTIVGFVAGAATAVGLDLIYGYVVNPVHTMLLRAPSDAQYFKLYTELPTRGSWDEANLRVYDRVRRSYDYFPNWRYGANVTTFEAPDEVKTSIKGYRLISIEEME